MLQKPQVPGVPAELARMEIPSGICRADPRPSDLVFPPER